MRPALRLLSNELIERIVAEARDVLSKLGVEIHNHSVLEMLADHGAEADFESRRVRRRRNARAGGALEDPRRCFPEFVSFAHATPPTHRLSLTPNPPAGYFHEMFWYGQITRQVPHSMQLSQ